MTADDKMKAEAHELARAIAPVVGFAHRGRAGQVDSASVTNARQILGTSALYFRSRGDEELAASIERLGAAMEAMQDVERSAENVFACLRTAFPGTRWDAPPAPQ